MSNLEIYNSVRIHESSDYWYVVEDVHVDSGCSGITISYNEKDKLDMERMCFSNEAALAIADAIYTLLEKDKNEL